MTGHTDPAADPTRLTDVERETLNVCACGSRVNQHTDLLRGFDVSTCERNVHEARVAAVERILAARAAATPAAGETWDHESDRIRVMWSVVRNNSSMGHGEHEDQARADYAHRAKTLHRGESIRLVRTTTRERYAFREDVVAERTKPEETPDA